VYVLSVAVCKKPLDLAIVMESSRKLGESDFRKVKMFAKDLVKALNVEKSETEIALLSYSDTVKTHLIFDEYKGQYIIILKSSFNYLSILFNNN
jgi:hypothetical protein